MTAKGQIKLAHVEVGDQERQSQIRARVGVKFDGDASFFFLEQVPHHHIHKPNVEYQVLK
jgi:hypothetical protein